MNEGATNCRELLLLRHGKAERGENLEDLVRPLKNKGKRAAQRMGVYLLRHRLIPDHIISSNAERAITSAQKCCKSMGLSVEHIHAQDGLYAADCTQLLQIIAASPVTARRVMIVGHNPGLEQTLRYLLAAADHPVQQRLSSGCLARLQMPDDWSRLLAQQARLLSLVEAGQLPKKFPFPDVDGTELRDRPAYYYSQSSVIPYRLAESGIEILITGSSKMKHWVMPKGIIEPGLSPQASAAKEALEEAGIEGHIRQRPIGSYCYPKWGASCTVKVYPMEVKSVRPDSEWEENHRGRRWVSAEVAAQQIREKALLPMLTELITQLQQQPD